MVEFRRMIPVLAVLAFLLGSAVTASAQQPLTCVTNGGVNTPARAEGLTELVGDFQVLCTGGVPTVLGAPIPTVTIQIFLNTQVTSRCMESTSTTTCIGLHSEALLILDDPSPATQYGCATNTCTSYGNGLGTANPPSTVGYYGSGVTGSSVTGCTSGTTVPAGQCPGNNKNIFQGIQTAANSITFLGIPIDPPGTSGSRIIRITNIRANANGLGVASGNNAPTSITEQITATPFNFLPVSGLATQAVGSVQLGLNFTLRPATGSDPFVAKTLQQCISNFKDAPVSGTQIAFLRYQELFSTSFKKRSIDASVANPSALATLSQQNNLTIGTYNTETGFRNSALTLPFATVTNTAGAALVGDADWGTRLKAQFNGIPAGVRLYVGSTATSTTGPDVATLTAGESAAYAAVAGPITELTVSNGSATAVWEVLESDPNSFANLNFPVYVRYTASPATNSPALGTATVNGSYAPISTVTTAVSANIPRFADTSTAKNLLTVVPCVTNLLFPFVTTALGFDTGLAISATSIDPFGTSGQSGTCTAYWYGAAFTGSTPFPTTASITAGTTAVGLASTILNTVPGGFSGYMIAVCRFQYAHGFAFVSDLGARNIAMGYLALVIPDPARNPNPMSLSLAGSGEQLVQ